MPRRSKDFQELLKDQKQSQDKRQNLEELKQKVQAGSFGELAAEMVIEPEGAEKMSEVLREFVAPYMDSVKNIENHRSLLGLAVAAWNASLLPLAGQQKMIDSLLKVDLIKRDRGMQQDIKELLDEMITRKKKYFSNNKRFITDFQLKQTGKQYHLSVASSLAGINK